MEVAECNTAEETVRFAPGLFLLTFDVGDEKKLRAGSDSCAPRGYRAPGFPYGIPSERI